MERRTVLKSIGASFGAAVTPGCLDDFYGDGGEEEVEGGGIWTHTGGAEVHAADEDRVYCFGDRGVQEPGIQVFALDADSGELRWTYPEEPSRGFTDLAVDEGVYFGRNDDAIGSGSGSVVALDLNGGLRWVDPVGSVYDAPAVDDGALFVGSDTGHLRALDTEDGGEIWSQWYGEGRGYPVITSVESNRVYVAAGDLHALHRGDGEELWKIPQTGDTSGTGASVIHGDRVFYRDDDELVAVVDGEEVWRREGYGGARPRLYTHGRLYLSGEGAGLKALDPSDGDVDWTADVAPEKFPVVTDDSVYVLEAGRESDERHGTLTRVDSDGEVKWRHEDTRLLNVQAYEDQIYGVSREDDGTAVHRLAKSSGDERWRQPVPDGVRSYTVADGRLYAGGSRGVYAYDSV